MNEKTELAITVAKEIANNPKTNGIFGASFVMFGNFFESVSSFIPVFMLWGGAILLGLSIYNQLRIAFNKQKDD